MPPVPVLPLAPVLPWLLLVAVTSRVAAVDQAVSPMSGMYCSDGSRVFCLAVYADSVSSETVTFQMEGPADAGYISIGIGTYMVNSDIQRSG
ncbi:hypothetical protein BJ742DRAFT_400853 [Cladochytrium replicatum]|nr:hypothetical protein BJ742DRAFT_400853 [Cladochytrium replicatum]